MNESSSCNSCASGKAGTVTNASTEASGCAVHCRPGYYSAAPYPTVCNDCPVNTYSDSWLTGPSCTACPPWSSSPIQSNNRTNCTCNKGYTGADGGPCFECDPGTFKAQSGSAACQECAAGSYHSMSAQWRVCIVCAAGKYANGTGSPFCRSCPLYSYSSSGSVLRSNCTCNKGYTGADGGPCFECDPGTFKAQSGSAACQECAAGSYHSMSAQWQVCIVCAAGKYSAGTGASVCNHCPLNSFTSGTGSIRKDDCFCNSGYFGSQGTNCSACAAGRYQTGCPDDRFPGLATYNVSAMAQYDDVWSHAITLMPNDGSTWTLHVEAKNLGTFTREFGYAGCGGWLLLTVPATTTAWTALTASSQRCSTSTSLDFEYRSAQGWSGGDAVYFRNIKLFKAATVPNSCIQGHDLCVSRHSV